MVNVTSENGSTTITADFYRLSTATDRPFVSVFDSAGELVCELFVPSSIHPLHDRDDTVALGPWHVQATEDEVVMCIEAQSSVWKHK